MFPKKFLILLILEMMNADNLMLYKKILKVVLAGPEKVGKSAFLR